MLKQQKHTYSKNLTTLTKQGLYDPTFEHDACGVGLVANIDGTKSHHIINQSLEVLINLGHRGAAGADPETGDGAGIMIQMPDEFFRKECAKEQIDLPNINSYGTGIVFLPTENQAKSNSMNLIENTTASENLRFLGWRKVPINLDAIGNLARKSCPVIYQFFVTKENSSKDEIPLELRLYLLRRQIEKKISAQLPNQTGFYICSLSSKKIVYKGLLHAHQVSDFYTELKDPTLKSGFGLVHSRFSTNTLGAWHLAHPYSYLIHNGEINTLRGNINWMAAREKTMESSILKNEIKKLTPEEFEETLVGEIFPPEEEEFMGIHTIANVENKTVVDLKTQPFLPGARILPLLRSRGKVSSSYSDVDNSLLKRWGLLLVMGFLLVLFYLFGLQTLSFFG